MDSSLHSPAHTTLAGSLALCFEMWSKWKISFFLVVAVLLSMIILRGTLPRKSELPTITLHGKSDADRRESQSVQTEVEIAHSPTTTEVQNDTETTEAHTTPKPVSPDGELASTADEVRACATV